MRNENRDSGSRRWSVSRHVRNGLSIFFLNIRNQACFLPPPFYSVSGLNSDGEMLLSQISGELGPEISRQLKILNLSSNLLSGQIPSQIANCSRLQQLDLSLNLLTGKIPDTFGTLRLKWLSLFNNSLNGSIPESIFHISNLETLLLSFNQIHRHVHLIPVVLHDSKKRRIKLHHPVVLHLPVVLPYVVLMDATYKTNKYNLPFFEIVGVTSTNKTFSIAFAFMHNEQTSNYRWTLTCLKLTINNSFCPRVIVTDRDLALMKACEDVFPESNHLLCRWHIFNDITKHCRPRINLQKTWGSLHAKWKKLVESPTPDAYIENYENLQELLFNHADVFDYLYSVWLGKYAERFVSLWTDKHINFGNSTTTRVESQHAKLKKQMESRKCDLDKFIYVIEKVVQSQEIAIKESFTRSIIIRKPRFKDQIFDELRRRVSNHAVDKILEELHRPKGFFPNPENCGCQMRTCYGLPCAHELAMYVGSGSSIPLDSVDAFWRKLDLSSSVSVAYGDLNIDHRMERLKETFDSQPDHIKYQYIRRMEEITDPSKILINEPSVKKNTRGRPKTKRVQHQKQAPHRYSCSDLHQQPPMHNSSFVDLNTEPSRHSSYEINLNEAPINQCSYMFDLNEEPPMGHSSFLNEIPSIFHPYITHIQNVMGDGNCGFRSIAVCLGYPEDEWLNIRQQLHQELWRSYHDYAKVFIGCDEIVTSLSFFFANKPAPPKHWMLMPETGILIANTYGVVVQFLTNQGSATFFPLWRGPNEFENHRVITFALVYNNHYVMVQLQGECPMRPISVLWTRHKTPPATLWETMYKSRLQFYKQLKPTERCFMTLDD